MKLHISTNLKVLAGLLATSATFTFANAADEHELRSFKKIQLSEKFYSEGSGIADFNQDGKMDVVYGPLWYEGPDFKKSHAIYEVKDFDPKGYSNNFITMIDDVNGDDYPDVLVNEWPGKAVHWFENPKGEGEWKKHMAFQIVDNESPQYGDITGDGKNELIFHTGSRLGYAQPGEDPTKPWEFTAVSRKEGWGRYQHGLGFGDINGDKKPDFLMSTGWWEHGKLEGDGSGWKKHEGKFGTRGGAQMYAYDVDGDGDNDIVTSLDGHGYGLAWFEHVEKDGQISFEQHDIIGSKPEDNPYGVKFSQLHAVCLEDMDGDGLKDIITGKRYWAHGPKGDAEPDAPAVLYWFKLTRGDDGVHFIPYQIDDDSGVGTQFSVGDVNGDGRPDVVTGNKKGGYVFIQEVKKVSKEDWEKAQPKKVH